MSVSNLELVRHILVETAFILQHTEQKSKEDAIHDDVLCRALVRSLEIIGEASKKLDDEFKTANNHIEWKKMAGTRDKLIHEYFGIDYDIVWDVIETKIQDLDYFLKELV
ncbi:HepT-like ribonuclease domain-containing protein [Aquirufa regiilacus]